MIQKTTYLLIGIFIAGAAPSARAANRFFIADAAYPEGARGRKASIRCEHDVAINAFSFSIRYDPGSIQVTGIDTAGTSAQARDFFEGTHNAARGEIAFGAVLDQLPPFDGFLAPAQDHTLAQLTFNILAASGSSTSIEFVDGLGTFFPIKNILTDTSGRSIPPVLAAGVISVGEASPIADAGPDRPAIEKSSIILDGTASVSAHGGPLLYQWRQVLGPPVASVSGINSPQWTITLPPVVDDTPLIFELEVREGEQRSTDIINVNAIDADLRKAAVSAPSGQTARLLPGGAKALIFTGEIAWQTRLEDGVWAGVAFTPTGDGDAAALLSSASLRLDSNQDGNPDDGDEELGSLPIPGDRSPLQFTFDRTIREGEPRRFFLVVEKSETPAALRAAGAMMAVLLSGIILTALLSLAGGDPGKKETRVSIAAQGAPAACGLALLLLGLQLSCSGGGGGGGGGSSPPPGAPQASRQVRFSISNGGAISVRGASTGVRGAAEGLPMDGPPFEFP